VGAWRWGQISAGRGSPSPRIQPGDQWLMGLSLPCQIGRSRTGLKRLGGCVPSGRGLKPGSFRSGIWSTEPASQERSTLGESGSGVIDQDRLASRSFRYPGAFIRPPPRSGRRLPRLRRPREIVDVLSAIQTHVRGSCCRRWGRRSGSGMIRPWVFMAHMGSPPSVPGDGRVSSRSLGPHSRRRRSIVRRPAPGSLDRASLKSRRRQREARTGLRSVLRIDRKNLPIFGLGGFSAVDEIARHGGGGLEAKRSAPARGVNRPGRDSRARGADGGGAGRDQRHACRSRPPRHG
jgi:hypothetical protein